MEDCSGCSCKENEAGRFLLCSVVDLDGKFHNIYIPEGRGLVRRWVILAEKSRVLGIKLEPVQKRVSIEQKFREKDKIEEGNLKGTVQT